MKVRSGYNFAKGDYVFTRVSNAVKNFKSKNFNCEVVDLGVGDVKFPPPEIISEEIIKQSKFFIQPEGFCGYPLEEGILELRQEISEYYNRLGAEVFEDEIFITNGAKPAIGELFELCDFKRGAIITPTYPLYEELCSLHGVEIDFYKSDSKNSFPLPQKSVDVAFFCSPNNPMGHTLSVKQTQELCSHSAQNNYLAVIDGAYADFTSSYIPPYAFENSSNVIEVRSYSKNLCFTGLRLGYTVIKRSNPIYSAYKRYVSLRSNGVNVIMQRVALLAYSKECVTQQRRRVDYYRKNAQILKKPFEEKGLTVYGGINAPYLVVNVNKNGEEFFNELLHSAGVVVTPGEAFRAENCVRVSCLCTRENAINGAKQITRFFNAEEKSRAISRLTHKKQPKTKEKPT